MEMETNCMAAIFLETEQDHQSQKCHYEEAFCVLCWVIHWVTKQTVGMRLTCLFTQKLGTIHQILPLSVASMEPWFQQAEGSPLGPLY